MNPPNPPNGHEWNTAIWRLCQIAALGLFVAALIHTGVPQ